MSTAITLSAENTTPPPKTVPIPDNTERVIFDTAIDRPVQLSKKDRIDRMHVCATHSLQVIDEDLGILRNNAFSKISVPSPVPPYVFSNEELLLCIDIVKGNEGTKEAFLRAVPTVPEQTKTNLPYKTDCSHLIKLPLCALMEIKKNLDYEQECKYNTSDMDEEDVSKLVSFFDKIPKEDELEGVNMQKKDSIDKYEKGKPWRIDTGSSDDDGNFTIVKGFESSSIDVKKKTASKRPPTKDQKRKRENDERDRKEVEIKDELEELKKKQKEWVERIPNITETQSVTILEINGTFDESKVMPIYSQGKMTLVLPHGKP